MSEIYARFAASEPNGCPDLKPEDRGPGKFEILLDWLRDKYLQWQNPTAVSSSVNYLDYEKPVPLNSLYVERPTVESDCFEAIAIVIEKAKHYHLAFSIYHLSVSLVIYSFAIA